MSTTNPIRVPASPFWSVFKRFGRDELTGGVIALIATALLELYFHISGLTASVLLLVLAGPVVEKVGFFFWHIKEAWDSYRTTLPVDRLSFGSYIKSAFKGGMWTLIEDVFVHDPLYVALMFGGLWIHPEIPAWLIVPIAFGIAVVAVAFLEVGFNEFRYKLFQKKLFNKGFEQESYLEARFHLDPSVDPDEVLEQLRQAFLPDSEPFTLNYSDTYYSADLPCFNGRSPRVRIRRRDKHHSKNQRDTVQVIYTRAEEQRDETAQFRFFPVMKDKFYLDLSKYVSWEELKLNVGEVEQKIQFTRKIVKDPERLLISIDSIEGANTIVEIKAYPDKAQLLKEAMRLIMHRFQVLQTTKGKAELLIS